MKRILFTILISMFIASSCSDRHQHPGTGIHYTIKPEVLQYFNWQKGSYWIFVDSLTGKTDSFAVVGYSKSSDITSDNGLNDNLGISIREFYDTITGYKLWGVQMYAIGATNEMFYYDTPPGYKDYIEYDVNPFTLSNNNSLLPSFDVGQKSYSNVLKSVTDHEAGKKDEIFLNADSGLIKINLDNRYVQKNLVLQRSHIIH